MKKKILFIILALIIIAGIIAFIMLYPKTEKTTDNLTDAKGGIPEKTVIEPKLGKIVKIGDDLYYWKLDSGSRDASAIFANYTAIRNYENSLVKLDKDKNETEILKTAGEGTICVTDSKIFYESTEGNTNKVCSVDLDGNNKEEYIEGNMKCLVGDYIYVQEKSAEEKISSINVKTGESTEILTNAEIIGVAEEYIYYAITDYITGTLQIGNILESKNNGILEKISKTEYDTSLYSTDYSNVTFVEFKYVNNKVSIIAGDIQGTGYFLQQGFRVEMNADGSNITKTPIDETDGNVPDSLLLLTNFSVDYTDGLEYTDLSTDEKTMLLTPAEVTDEFGFVFDDEHWITVYSADKYEDEIYITLENGEHYPAEDIGWRYSYKRTNTVVFSYNLETKEITKLYEF